MASSSDRNGARRQSNSQKKTTSNSSRSNSSRGTSTTRKTSSSRNVKQTENEFSVIDEIVLIIAFAVVIFLFLCTIGVIKGSAEPNLGDYIKNIMLGVFGYTAYIVPIVTFFVMALGISNRNNHFVWIKIGSVIALVMVIGILMHMICYGDIESYASEKGWPKTFYDGQNGGGVVFGAVTLLVCNLIGKVGTIFLLLVITIIALVLLTGKSFIKGVKQGSRKIYETTREEGEHFKEYSAKLYEEAKSVRMQDNYDEDEEPKTLRRNKKVNGVTLNTTVAKKAEEIPVNEVISETESREENPLFPFAKFEDAAKDESLVIRKESSDIHQIEYTEEDDDAWVKPVSIKNDTHEDDEIAKPIRLKMVEEVKEPEPEVSFTSSMEDEIKPVSSKPVAHLRSRDKSDMSAVLDRPVKETMAPLKEKKEYKFPPINLLKKGEAGRSGNENEDLAATARRLEETLETFGVRVKVTDYSKGPAVTRYELHPEQGVKVSRILSLADDIKLNLAASDIRIEAPIPGKMAVGIEVPNKNSSAVHFRDLIDNNEFKSFPSNLSFAVGKDIGGQLVIADIAKMPHVLIAGATGSGKSVCINTLIMSILYKAHPDDVKMIMIDPKVVELNVYNGIPHLMIPVVTDPKKASAALAWGVAEMTERYKKFADAGVRDLKGYNQKAEQGESDQEGQPMKKMPQIVIIVDELADLMMVASKEVEESICRLAQLARAAGIHLIIATQRPSVDVITGLIKANMPSRIAFSVSSGIDSRTILDANGAEKLLGKGDMLFFPQGYSKPARVQGAFVSDKEVADVVDFIKNQSIANDYGERIEEAILSSSSSGGSAIGGSGDEYDSYFAEAGRFVIEKEKGSIGMLQRVFKIGFNRAARIMDQLEEAGVVGPEEGTKPRRILMSISEFENYLEER